MKDNHAELLLNEGEILINNLKHYQSSENISIKDESEGYKIISKIQPEKDIKTLVKSEHEEHFKDIKNIPEHQPLIRVKQIEILQKNFGQDVYAYCTSMSSEKNLFEGYNSCIEITNINFFNVIAKELFRRKLISLSIVNGARYIGIEGKIIYSKDKKIDSSKEGVLPQFVKDISYQHEKEYRIIYKPVLSHYKQHAIPTKLYLPELKKYCKRIW